MLLDENKTLALLVVFIFVSAPPLAFRERVAVQNSLFFYRSDICGRVSLNQATCKRTLAVVELWAR